MIINLKDVDVRQGLYSYTGNIGNVQEQIEKGLNTILCVGNICTMHFKSDYGAKTTSFIINESQKAFFKECDEYDVLEVDENRILKKRYAKKDGDCTIYTSAQCNSNCVMCPIGETQRRTEELEKKEYLLELIRYLPRDVEHVTITGGEPFLLKEDFLEILACLRERCPNTQVLLLTNGRAFANQLYARQYMQKKPLLCTVGIPIHGSNEEKHDAITQAKGSFLQTVLGIKHLIQGGEKVEIRIVVSKLNQDDITEIAKTIISTIPGIASVKIMGLEMLGSAAVHCEDVWIEYDCAMKASEKAIELLLSHGIDVELYNFPLCVVRRKFWGLYRKSIDLYKVRYLDLCEQCDEKSNCGGFFLGTIRMVQNIKPIVKW